MALIPGVNMYSTTGAVQIQTYVSNAAIAVGDLVFMVTASGKVDVVAAGTNILQSSTGSGIVGIAVSAVSAANLGVQVAIIDSNTRLVLPCLTAPTLALMGTATNSGLYPLVKSTTAGTIGSLAAVIAATDASGVAHWVNIAADAGGFTQTMSLSTDGLTGGVVTPKSSGFAVGDLGIFTIAEVARWCKG